MCIHCGDSCCVDIRFVFFDGTFLQILILESQLLNKPQKPYFFETFESLRFGLIADALILGFLAFGLDGGVEVCCHPVHSKSLSFMSSHVSLLP